MRHNFINAMGFWVEKKHGFSYNSKKGDNYICCCYFSHFVSFKGQDNVLF